MTITEIPYNQVLQLRQTVMYPDKDIDFVKLPDDNRALHMGVTSDKGEVVCVGSLFIDGRSIQLRKLATRTDMQRKGIASKFMNWLTDYANEIKLDRLWCNARIESVDFYKQFGYQQTSESFSKDGHDYLVMEKLFDR